TRSLHSQSARQGHLCSTCAKKILQKLETDAMHLGKRWIPKRSATPSTALVPQRKVGFPIPNAGLLLGFQGTKTARREGISSPFSDAGGCTSPQNSGRFKYHRYPSRIPSFLNRPDFFGPRMSTINRPI